MCLCGARSGLHASPGLSDLRHTEPRNMCVPLSDHTCTVGSRGLIPWDGGERVGGLPSIGRVWNFSCLLCRGLGMTGIAGHVRACARRVCCSAYCTYNTDIKATIYRPTPHTSSADRPPCGPHLGAAISVWHWHSAPHHSQEASLPPSAGSPGAEGPHLHPQASS